MNLSDFILRFRLGEGEWQIYELLGENTLIGRGDDNDLVLDHREVSRHHLRLRLHNDVFQLIDLESSNGTQLDGIALAPQIATPLRPGQIIEVGDFSLVLEKSEDGSIHISKEMLPYLIRYRFGTGTWQTFPLDLGEITLGRDPNCNFHLNDLEVSREHARVRIDGDGIWLTDLGSTNGTQINNVDLVPQEEHNLKLGQMFSIGNFILQIDEPSRFYNASSAISGKPGSDEILTREHQPESVKTVIDADALMLSSPPARTVNLISRKRVTIGRNPDNDMVLNHPLVNSHHAVIDREGTRFRIRDLRSAYGVFVNGRHVERENFLKDWDQIRIGAFTFVLSGEDLQYQTVPGLKLEAHNVIQQVKGAGNVLNDINFTANPKELVALVGVKESGKTALLNALSGSRPASHGKVLINGIDLYEHFDLFRSDIGYVPQTDIVHAELTAEAALNYVARLRLSPDITKQERNALVSDLLKDLDLLESRKTRISELSDGQNKRLLIGCELITKPRLLFFDEPTQGVNPGANDEIMKLMRHLADQGRTLISILPANQNLILCDKVIILTQGGNLVFFGVPEDALTYFDQYRSDSERFEKEMVFADIYRILNDSSRGTPSEWRERYLNSPAYQRAFGIEPVLVDMHQPYTPPPVPEAEQVKPSAQRWSGFRQFWVLSSRNLMTLAKDKISLIIMFGLAPLLGLAGILWGRDLYDPVHGEFYKVFWFWFMGTLAAILVGALSSLRAIVTEVDIYKHERKINLKIMPYIFSKAWIGLVLGLYQAAVLLGFRYIFVNPTLLSQKTFLALYMTFFLGITTGYLLGLLISAIAPNQNFAMILLIFVMVPQILFAGALLPFDWFPGSLQISVLMPSRWIFESSVRITGLGEELTSDPCWVGYEQNERFYLSKETKEGCPCMGASIFTECVDFPGIFSPVIDNEASLMAAEPAEPLQPTEIAYPTAIPSPTPLPTPTLLPSPTPFATPRTSVSYPRYLEKVYQQGEEYRGLVSDQFEQYRLDSLTQSEEYSQVQTAQSKEYADLQHTQADGYSATMQTYYDERSAWQTDREKTINRAETVLGLFYDNYNQVLQGSVLGRWVIIVLMQLGLFALIVIAQKRKDSA